MNDYFENELIRIEREILNLKTSQQKFAGDVPLVTKSISVSFNLHNIGDIVPQAIGNKAYRVTFQNTALMVPTLAHYYDDANKSEDFPRTTRYMYLTVGRINSNQYIINVNAYGTQWTENSDAEIIKRGGSVTLSNVLTVQSTDNFTLEAI
jgi:hypothetical protein